MKKLFLIFNFSILIFNFSLAQVICVFCIDQNTPISTGISNLIQNGGFENGCNAGAYFCPNSAGYLCDFNNWACTGVDNMTYARAVNSTFSVFPEGAKAAYF